MVTTEENNNNNSKEKQEEQQRQKKLNAKARATTEAAAAMAGIAAGAIGAAASLKLKGALSKGASFLQTIGLREIFLLLVIAVITQVIGSILITISHDNLRRAELDILKNQQQHQSVTENTDANMLSAMERQQSLMNDTSQVVNQIQLENDWFRTVLERLDQQQSNQIQNVISNRAVLNETKALVSQLAVGVNNSATAIENQQKEFQQSEEILENQRKIIALLEDIEEEQN